MAAHRWYASPEIATALAYLLDASQVSSIFVMWIHCNAKDCLPLRLTPELHARRTPKLCIPADPPNANHGYVIVQHHLEPNPPHHIPSQHQAHAHSQVQDHR